MADLSNAYAIRKVATDAITGASVIPPINANAIRIENPDTTNNLLVRSDPNDSTTQKTIQPLSYAVFGRAYEGSVTRPHDPCFPKGQAGLFVLTSASTITMVCEFS